MCMCFDLYVALDNYQKSAHMTKGKILMESVALLFPVMEYVEEYREDIALTSLIVTHNMTVMDNIGAQNTVLQKNT